MTVNYLAIFVATVLEFVFSAVWYTPIFGKTWGKIHGFDRVSPEEQKKMMAKMGPLLGMQFLMTLLTTIVLALFVAGLPDWNVYGVAGFLWLGFVLPTQVGAVLFGGTDPKWVVTKIAIMAGASLFALEIAAAVLHLMSSAV